MSSLCPISISLLITLHLLSITLDVPSHQPSRSQQTS